MHAAPDIRNYYERLVIEYLNTESSYYEFDSDLIADICCLALSRLPARYIRHDIDMAFYLSSTQRSEMLNEVKVAVDESLEYLLNKDKLKAAPP